MYSANRYPSSSSGPPPPPPGYDHYQSYPPPPPPPTSLPPPPPPSQQWDRSERRGSRDSGRDSHYNRDRSDEGRSRGPYSSLRQPRGSYPDSRDSRDSRERRDSRDSHNSRDRRDRRDPHHARDDYRPPRGEFSFRQEAPGGIGSHKPPPYPRDDDRGADTYKSRHDGPRWPRGQRSGQRSGQPRHGGPYQRREKEKAADRLLLSKRFDDKAELMLGDTAIRATYRDIDELSDDDEVDMDISDNGDSDTDAADRPTKRARTDRSATVAQQDMPKWSNPDPYTALPPPETTRKKDVVQLIRKARVEAEAPKPAVASEAADFISCDFSDDDTSSQVHGNHTGETLRPDAGTDSHYPPLGPRDTLSSLPPKPPAPAYQQGHQLSGKAQSVQSLPLNPTRRSNKDVAPVDLHPTTSLGNRKRTIDDEIKLPVKPPHATLKKVNRMPSGGSITLLWRPTEGEEPCPWVSTDHSGVSNMGIRLHLEIRDFYGYVEPRDFEKKIRQELVSRLDQLVRKRWQDARVLPFGSFMSGLYLPTADMDIAICSKAFIERGSAVYDKKKSLYNMRAHLEKYKVHYGGPIEAITKAKVPLLKYTDNHTGLKVDISFEKMDGYNAVNTFRKWREQYPAMPPLVAVIKHFLLMRALNEPVNGGIGGFSVICMVVHLLQMMPEVQSRSMGDEQLGYLFMEFLDYYGNKFNYELVAIRMDPPGTVNKSKASTLVYRNLDRLSIIDPNNPENDISGGSSNYSKVKSCFAEAYDTLQKTMQRLASETSNAPSNDVKDTLLYPLLGGNYSYFRCQRDWLQKLDREGYPEYSIPAKDSYWDEPGFW